ncbi:staphylococcal nuclease domain-containing protein 1-like [Diaphorina citri]|uniref:Staphylococcal nuclease domain-containing protein 1-like n=1 Tax=Diaphorina citri TaxID=121845 RepID=A0A3Q0J6V6_DIACI|nr:staphylococcal nuclease domain-containing protein 1-like [Diaphorina citri]
MHLFADDRKCIVRENEEYGREVRQYLEERILQRDVNVIIESVQNEKNRIMNATLIHEFHISFLRIGLFFVLQKERAAVVLEIINGDGLVIKYVGDTKEEKVFLSSIKPPRPDGAAAGGGGEGKAPVVRSKPLYDVPWLYEAREFLRTRLIGKKVMVSEDYAQDARDKFPEKKCVSVFVGQE